MEGSDNNGILNLSEKDSGRATVDLRDRRIADLEAELASLRQELRGLNQGLIESRQTSVVCSDLFIAAQNAILLAQSGRAMSYFIFVYERTPMGGITHQWRGMRPEGSVPDKRIISDVEAMLRRFGGGTDFTPGPTAGGGNGVA